MGLRGINATPLPRNPRKALLTSVEQTALMFGNNWQHNFPPVFKTKEQYFAAWQRHRNRNSAFSVPVRGRGRGGCSKRRPGLQRPKNSGEETILLYEHGLLTPAEIEKLMPIWKHYWQIAQEPHFTHHTGGDVWLDGSRAVKAHRIWAGVLLKIWIAFDEERAATISALS